MDVTPQVPKPSWLASRPVVCTLGSPPRCAMILELSDHGIAQALSHGCAALQAAARAMTAAQGATGEVVWRYARALPTSLPNRLDRLPTLDRLLGRFDQRDPLLIQRRDSGEEMELTFHVPHDTTWFDGHFAGNPVLPGVAQLRWAITAAREIFPGGQLHAVHQLKFKAPIRPESIVSLHLSGAQAAGMLKFRFRSAGGENSSGVLQWQT